MALDWCLGMELLAFEDQCYKSVISRHIEEGCALSDGAKRVPGKQKGTRVTQEDMTENIPYTAGTRGEPGTTLNAEISHLAQTG